MLPGFGAGLVLIPVNLILGISVIVTWVLMLAAVFGATRGIFTVALYRYATDGQPPFGFSSEALGGPTRP